MSANDETGDAGERERKTDQEADEEDQERQGGKKVPRDGLQDQEGLVGRTKDSGGPMVPAIRQYGKRKRYLVTPLLLWLPFCEKAYRRCADSRY